jgi:hypothetical protein
MKRRPRIYYSDSQKAVMWERGTARQRRRQGVRTLPKRLAPSAADEHAHRRQDAHLRRRGTGHGNVLYANAALQGALTTLRDTKRIDEDPTLVAPFAECQRLVDKAAWNSLENVRS